MKRFFILFVLIFAHLTAFAQTSPSFDATLEAVQHGDVDAQYMLGHMCKTGKSVRQDKIQAKEYFGKACDRGYQLGCDNYRILNTL